MTRLANLTDGTGYSAQTGQICLVRTQTVQGDAVIDKLFGGGGRGWFFAESEFDTLDGLTNTEQVS